jgi:hypothetical protein
MTMKHYEWWTAALKDPSQIGKGDLAIHENDPQVGFYRKREKGSTDKPVAIWLDSETNQILATVGDNATDPNRVWTWVAKSPVSYDDYNFALENGRWPDDPILHKHTDINVEPGIGHNAPPDEFAMLSSEIETFVSGAETVLQHPITGQQAADMTAAYAKRLTEMASKADKLRKAEKEPHLEAGKAVDAKWNPHIDNAKDAAGKLKRHLDSWMREQQRLEEERQRAARAEAERIRREAEEAERRAAEAARAIEEADISKPLDIEAAQEVGRAQAIAERKAAELREAEREAQARKVNAGRTGAKVSYRDVIVGRITDRSAFLYAVSAEREIEEALEKICGRLTREGRAVAGMEIVKEKKVA